MPATKKRPTILFLDRRNTAKRKAIAKAVKDMADLRKNDRKAYEALIKEYAGRPVNIVPG